MNVVAAVSGGVDSVVLLDMLVHKQLLPHHSEIIVAHFEHGIRGEASKADARFVELLSKHYSLRCEIGHGALNKNASEAEARVARYEFLQSVAKKYDAAVVTAHHSDDVIETIAINVQRGTGWRGVQGMNDTAIVRPLLDVTKAQVYDYALKHGLEWVEDETNRSDRYLRNRLRRQIGSLPAASRQALLELRRRQLVLAASIDSEVEEVLSGHSEPYKRYFFIMIEEKVACELLRSITQARITRPQLQLMLGAIKAAKPGTNHALGNKIHLQVARDFFTVTHQEKMIQ